VTCWLLIDTIADQLACLARRRRLGGWHGSRLSRRGVGGQRRQCGHRRERHNGGNPPTSRRHDGLCLHESIYQRRVPFEMPVRQVNNQLSINRRLQREAHGLAIRELLLGPGDGSGRRPAARIVPILHAFLEESITRLALQSLLVRTELAGRHFLLRIDCKTWSSR